MPPASRASTATAGSTEPLQVVFLHPNLGIGGAERLIVDAALALQREHRHKVVIYTSHHDPTHCFSETADGTLEVRVHGSWLPSTLLFGKGHIVCAWLRSLYTALCLIVHQLTHHTPPADILLIDQISLPIPLLHLCLQSTVRTLFYCHFPDLLLTKRTSLLKKLYRLPTDYLEAVTTAAADLIVVNSKYTLSVVQQTFPQVVRQHKGKLPVLYPATDTSKFDNLQNTSDSDRSDTQALHKLPANTQLFVSLNRYERKKNIGLAISAVVQLRQHVSAQQFKRVKLVIAGGYDHELRENVEHYPELQQICKTNELTYAEYPSTDATIIFIRNCSDQQKFALFQRSLAVIYTPTNEHFGIVPIEAMYNHCPVIACNSGGPTESVVDGVTGWLCAATAEAFVEPMAKLCTDEQLKQRMGEAGRRRVVEQFSFETFSNNLNQMVVDLAATRSDSSHSRFKAAAVMWLSLVIMLLATIAGSTLYLVT